MEIYEMTKLSKKQKLIEYNRNHYYQHGKEWHKRYAKEYYKENKDKMKITAKEHKENYDRPKKNIIRENIINIIEQSKIKRILTLESQDFIFSNLLPNKNIIVFENRKEIYNKMEKSKPKNVKLFYGDISKFADLDAKVDMVYLDFCGIYEFSKSEIYVLKSTIRRSKLFAVTFALRVGNVAKENGFKQFGDYQFDLIRKLQELLDINFKVLYGEAYRDTQPMVTIVFENPGEKE